MIIKQNYSKIKSIITELDELKLEYTRQQAELYGSLRRFRTEISAELTILVSNNANTILKEWPYTKKISFSVILRKLVGTGRISIQRAVCYRLYNMGLLEHAKYPWPSSREVVSGFVLTTKGEQCKQHSGCDLCDYKFQCAMADEPKDYYYI